MYKVLRPGGRAIVMEFSLPKNPIIKLVYLLYFRYILPFFGKIISKHKTAYSYLNQTVEEFPYGKKFADNFYESGFSKVDIHPLTFGIASIYVATKINEKRIRYIQRCTNTPNRKGMQFFLEIIQLTTNYNISPICYLKNKTGDIEYLAIGASKYLRV